MIRSRSVLILLFAVSPVFGGTLLEPLLIRISSVDAAPTVEPLLRTVSSSPFNQYCETVVLDTEHVSDALGRLSTNKSLLRETPVTVELPNGRTETYFGEAGGTNSLSEGRSVHYRGASKSEGVSYFSIGISPRGEVNARIILGGDEYTLGISNRLPTHFLCLARRENLPDW